MPVIAETEFISLSNREYWVTSDGRKLYPDQFEDEHLKNTINLLHKKCRTYRLEKAKEMCEIVYGINEPSMNVRNYYQYFRRQMNHFIDEDIDDKEWLKENSKIYNLLLDEANYRELEIDGELSENYTYTVERRSSRGRSFCFPVSSSTDGNTSTYRFTTR